MQIDIRISLWNANGISNHINELEMYMKDNNIDIGLITETHCTSRSNIRINGYNIIFANHPQDMSFGGSAIIIKNSLIYACNI